MRSDVMPITGLKSVANNFLVLSALSGISLGVQAQNVSLLEEVLVTAQKRSESLQDVTATVSAVGAEQISARGIKNVYDLKLVTPGLSISAPMGEGVAPLYTIRGVGAGDYLLNQSRPVATFLNEAVRSIAGLDFMPLYDIARVEVLAGPQGTLYGKNAVGGAVNIITERAGFENDGYLTLGYGNYNRKEVGGAIQAPIVDDLLAARFAFQTTKADGWVENDVPGVENKESVDIWSGRLSLLFTPSDNLDVNLVMHRSMSEGSGTNVYPVNDADIGFLIPGALPRSETSLDFFDENFRGWKYRA